MNKLEANGFLYLLMIILFMVIFFYMGRLLRNMGWNFWIVNGLVSVGIGTLSSIGLYVLDVYSNMVMDDKINYVFMGVMMTIIIFYPLSLGFRGKKVDLKNFGFFHTKKK